jgi:hypothetical protein
MISEKIISWLAGTAACLLFLAAGCAPPGEAVVPDVEAQERVGQVVAEEAPAAITEEPADAEVKAEEQPAEKAEAQITVAVTEPAVEAEVKAEKEVVEAEEADTISLALKFSPGQSATYRVITEAVRTVEWEGELPSEPKFGGGRRHNRLEMTFTQEIESVDEQGNAVARITVKGLKYRSGVEEGRMKEFDSSAVKDPNAPLALLVGQSYTIRIAPTGEVTGIVDATDARTAVRRGSSVPRTALRLLGPMAVKERHTIRALPPAGKNRLRTGDNWSSVKVFSFGLMGSKTYEKVYTLKEVKDAEGHRIATVQMNAIPSAEMAEELHRQQAASPFSEEFDDSTSTYTGELKVDLATGEIKKYFEDLRARWVVAIPPDEQEEFKAPAVLRMSDTRVHSLEKID